MQASLLLLETLEDLGRSDFDKFKWYLSIDILDGCKPIPKSHLEDASQINTVSKMTERYGEELAVSISIEILKRMNMNNAAEKLKKKYAEGKTASTSTSTSSSASAPPAAPASVSAASGGVVIAPTVSGCTTGSWNITINKT